MKSIHAPTIWRTSLLLLIVVAIAGCVSTVQPTLSSPTADSTLQPTAITPDAVPRTSLTPPTCTETRGKLLNATLPAGMLKHPLDVTVYLPPCYDAEKTKSYPTLYMLHGMTDTNTQWVDLGLTAAADRLITAQRIRPFMIVMPYELNWQLSPTESGYEAAITDVLIPWVEKTYRACPERDCRAIGGLSRGGNWAVKIGFDHWQLFTAIGAHSTPLFIGGIQELTTEVRGLPSLSDAPAVYLDAGSKDENLAAVKDFEKTLTELHVPHEYHLNSGYHDKAYWEGHVEDYLMWYAGELKN